MKIDMYTPVSMVKSDEMLSRKLQENLVCQLGDEMEIGFLKSTLLEFCSMDVLKNVAKDVADAEL